MKKFELNPRLSGLYWQASKPKGVIVISHGMAEHAARYDRFAKELVKHNYDVYAINQIGHGVPPVGKKGHWDKGDFNNCVENIHTLIQDITSKSKLNVILFGHSMGSFIAQEFISKHGKDITACVLSGSNGPDPVTKAGALIANILAIGGNLDKESQVMNNLSFGSYNKQFEPAKTAFDWLSRDEKEVQKYVDDENCGYCCTLGFFKEFVGSLAKLHKKEKIVAIPKKLPILIMSGDKDPVGANGNGVTKLYNLYKDNGIKPLKLKLYKDGHHEMLNELNRDEVTADLIRFFDSHIK